MSDSPVLCRVFPWSQRGSCLEALRSNFGPRSLEKPNSLVKRPFTLLELKTSILSVSRAALEFLGHLTLSETLFSPFLSTPAAVGCGLCGV